MSNYKGMGRFGFAKARHGDLVQRDAVIAAVTEALGDAYDCQRVWDAWSVGTMGQDDFALVAEDSDRVAEIADAAIDAMRPATPPAPGEVGEVGQVATELQELAEACDGTLAMARVQRLFTRAATLLEQQEARIADLRAALAECGRAVGSLIQGNCSDSFLLQVPAEVQLAVARPARGNASPPAPAPAPETRELSPKEIEAQKFFAQMRDEILHLSDGLEVNEVLGIIDNHTPEWV
jgi:hypothetical protein